MAAIIFGNPKEYAKLEREHGMALNPRFPHGYTERYLSHQGRARMLHKWADILEREGAAAKETGQIINQDKAVEIFERSKDLAEGLLSYDPGMRDR